MKISSSEENKFILVTWWQVMGIKLVLSPIDGNKFIPATE